MNTELQEFKERFFTFCKSSENILQIKKLFLLLQTKQQFDSDVLSYGLFAAFEKDQSQIVDMIFDFAKKISINITAETVQPSFNFAFINNNEKTIKYLDDKYNISSKIMEKKGFIYLTDDGKVFHGGGCGGPDHYEPTNNEKEYGSYFFNLFEYFIKKENQPLIESIINKSIKIEPSLVMASFIDCCDTNKLKSIVTLLSNEKTRNIIEASTDVNLYLSEPTEKRDVKEFVKATLKKIKLNEKLENDLFSKEERILKSKI